MDEVSSGVYRDEIEGFPYGRARDVMKQCLRLIVAVADNPSMCKFCQSVPIHVFCFWAVGQTTLKSRGLRVGQLSALCKAGHHLDAAVELRDI